MEDSINKDQIHLQSVLHDEAAFEAVFKNYYSLLYKAAYNILKNKEAAEDVVQDLFAKLWQKRSTIIINGSVKSYLYRAAMNACYDYLDKHKRELKEDPAMVVLSEDSTGRYMEEMEVQSKINAAISKLPPACREVFLLSREKEMSYKEIADTLQISVKTVENQLGKALKIMREELKPYIANLIKFAVLFFLYENF